MITINEFIYLYHLKEFKEFGYYEFVPWNRKSRLVVDLPSSFRNWKSFFVSGDGWELFLMTFGETSLGCCASGRPLILVRSLPMRFFFLILLLY